MPMLESQSSIGCFSLKEILVKAETSGWVGR